MLRIGLLSDTHGFLDKNIFKVFKDVDEIWHAGDIGTLQLCDELKNFKLFYAVFGNIDGKEIRAEFPLNLFLEREGFKILLTHIGGYPGKYNPDARKVIEAEKPGLFICGHSHILKVMFDKQNNLLHINPGAAGVHGFHKMKTAVRLEIEGKEMKNLAVIELGNRAG